MIKGLVLAGGKSSRFGSNKALAMYQGQTFLERSIQTLQEAGLDVVVSTAQENDYHLPNVQVIGDIFDQKGPLGGIYSAMSLFDQTDFLVLTCDMPVLDDKILRRLIHYYQFKNEALFYLSQDSAIEPFPGIYPNRLKSLIEKKINEDKLSMRSFIHSLDNKNTLLFEADAKKIMNINTVKEWKILNS